MKRRSFVETLALGALAGPGVARAQAPRKVYRIGILGSGIHPAADLAGAQPPSPFISALLRGLRELGYVYGEHFVTEPRSAEGSGDDGEAHRAAQGTRSRTGARRVSLGSPRAPRALEGATPGDLPIEQPTKFELVINLKAARSIGLTISRAMQVRADAIIQ